MSDDNYDPNKETERMQNLLDMMEKAETGEYVPPETSSKAQHQSRKPITNPSDEKEAIREDIGRILENFNAAMKDATEFASSNTNNDTALRQVTDTKYDDSNKTLSIGDYKIRKSEDGFDLLDENNIILLKDTMLYETAYTVASYLYEGHSFNSPKVLSVLNSSNKYEKYINDARLNKLRFNKYKKDYDLEKTNIERSKFDENKSKARTHKRVIMEQYRKLGK